MSEPAGHAPSDAELDAAARELGQALTERRWQMAAAESCTGGRNESYVVVEDPRHFADGARHHDELLYTALLPLAQFRAILHAGIDVDQAEDH